MTWARPATSTSTGITVARPAVVASLYAERGLAAHAQAIFEAWLPLVDPQFDKYYTDDASRRYRELSDKAQRRVATMLSPAGVAKSYRHVLVKSADKDGPVDACHAFSLEIFAAEDNVGFVYLTFPHDQIERHGAEVARHWFQSLGEQFDFSHGVLGLGYEIGWGSALEQDAYPLVMEVAQRHHGVIVWDRNTARFRESGDDAFDTVGWLTYLDNDTAADMELDDLDPRVLRSDGANGIVLQAGPLPDAADSQAPSESLELLREVNEVTLDIRNDVWLSQDIFEHDDAMAWFERLDP